MQLHQLQRNKKAKTKKRVGRGGLRGKTSGRGHKGQKARSGHSIRPEIRDAIKKIPKLRGYKFAPIKSKPVPVNLTAIENTFSAGDEVSPKTLINSGLVNRRKGKIPAIKILGTGALSKKVNVSGVTVSESAKGQIEKAGGKIK
jgi:large subunit ribosomal protein L15